MHCKFVVTANSLNPLKNARFLQLHINLSQEGRIKDFDAKCWDRRSGKDLIESATPRHYAQVSKFCLGSNHRHLAIIQRQRIAPIKLAL